MAEKKVTEEQLEDYTETEKQQENQDMQEAQNQDVREDADTESGEDTDETISLVQEMEELKQRLLRVSADFDNFRKRTRIEKEELAKYANSNLVTDILPVLDNFQRALDVKEASDEVKSFLKGMEMIYKQLQQILNQAGLESIKAVGEEFDPNKHEAVMQVEDTEAPDNTILEELRTGYVFKDKVIRPSMVKVAKNSG